ncbi:hypothetical protein AALP_AA6G277100 [Arabis alpina]|uniref:Uncharacterized protein n=1 Tax=Arabis alpina TaxID=50452 RepID=A0A087GS45_ARAAL|nr:hypothetical protein AALP_AA6G277100 [Arabis alpina]
METMVPLWGKRRSTCIPVKQEGGRSRDKRLDSESAKRFEGLQGEGSYFRLRKVGCIAQEQGGAATSQFQRQRNWLRASTLTSGLKRRRPRRNRRDSSNSWSSVSNGSSKIACLYTQQGNKRTNQDAMLVFEKFDKNITKRGFVPETTTKKGKGYHVGPILLGFFVFVVIGSCQFSIIP